MSLENLGLPLHFRTCMSCPTSQCFERKHKERELHKVHSHQHYPSKKTPSCTIYMIMLGLLPQMEQVMLHHFKSFQAVCLRT